MPCYRGMRASWGSDGFKAQITYFAQHLKQPERTFHRIILEPLHRMERKLAQGVQRFRAAQSFQARIAGIKAACRVNQKYGTVLGRDADPLLNGIGS